MKLDVVIFLFLFSSLNNRLVFVFLLFTVKNKKIIRMHLLPETSAVKLHSDHRLYSMPIRASLSDYMINQANQERP